MSVNILNLYSGTGGNRKLWGNEHKITAVELNPKIADMYQETYPKDNVIIADAHQYLLDHYQEFDFVWSSPPCPTHSRANYFLNAQGVIRYPDMMLWQEIIFLQQFCKNKFCVENVKSYYPAMFHPTEIGRHYLWSNFNIPSIRQPKKTIGRFNGKRGKDRPKQDKNLAERNEVDSLLGLHVLNRAMDIMTDEDVEQIDLFTEAK